MCSHAICVDRFPSTTHPKRVQEDNVVLYATFVLPAPNGCNLKCPFCAIKQRGEAAVSRLAPEDYVRFLTEVLVDLRVDRVGIQGYEPLLPEAWPTTVRMLRTATAVFCETSLVTNGVYLAERAPELAGLVESLAVSLDSAEAAVHDKLRGVPGTFQRVTEGLRVAAGLFPRKEVLVNSILLPGKTHYLLGMPKLLRELGVAQWSVSPAYDFRRGETFAEPIRIRDAMRTLSDLADREGIALAFSDEFREVADKADLAELMVESFEKGDEFFRLSPDASCARGREALGEASILPRWDPQSSATGFLREIFAEQGVALPSRRHRWVTRALLSLARRKS